MSVDLRQLAIDRGGTRQKKVGRRRHVLSRYVLPMMLVSGFLALVTWASWDILFPATPVTVVPVLATAAEIQQGGAPLFDAAGWIEPRPTPVRVAALSPGVVEKLHVVEDQPVKAGDTIAELIQDDAQLSLERAVADLELQQAQLEVAEATLAAATSRFDQPVHLEAALSEAAALLAKTETELTNLPFQIVRAEAEYAAEQKNYEGKLAAQGVVAGIEIDIARSRAESAKSLMNELRDRKQSLVSERTALEKRRDALRTQLQLRADETKAVDEAKAGIRAANARVAQMKVAVAEAKLQLSRMTIVAPIDGRVFQLIAHPGARIGGGTTQSPNHDGSTVVTMYRPDLLQVRVDVRFEDLPKLHLHQPVEIDNPALSTPIMGRVLFISSEADIQKNTLQVKVEIPHPPSVFKPEMLVDVTFLSPEITETREQNPEATSATAHLFIPQPLVWNENGVTYVWLADQSSGVARKHEIETGRGGENGLIEVLRGLNVSSRIIASGTEGLSHGSRIRVTGEASQIFPGPETPN